MRKVQTKQMAKRVFSVLMVLCMVFAMIPAENIFAAATKVAEDENGNITTTEFNTVKNGKSEVRFRQLIKENGADSVSIDNTKVKGTQDNPFVVLEVVTNPEYASIGYLVNGCEPVNMELLRGNEMAIKDLTGSANGGDFFGFGTWKKLSGNLFYFPDEPEGQITFYQNTNVTSKKKSDEEGAVEPGKSKQRFDADTWSAKEKTESKEIPGYYEVVKLGSGTHILKEESTTDLEGNPIVVRSIVLADKSNPAEVAQTTLVWHTTNTYLINQYKAQGLYNGLYLSLENLNNDRYFSNLQIDKQEYIGNRFYTVRIASTADPYYDLTGCLYEYVSNDLLVTKSIASKLVDPSNYSVVVKTITPADLKDNPGWADKADLVYFNCDLNLFYDKDNDGTQDEDEGGLLDLWQSTNISNKPMNRFQEEKSTSTTKGFKGSNELDANVAYTLLERVSKYKNYVSLVFDSSCLTDDCNDTKNVTYYRYTLDTQLKFDASGYGEIGYKNNLAKLWLACTSANPGFSIKYFFDGGVNAAGASVNQKTRIAIGDDGIMRFTSANMSGDDEREYWSGMSFYCAEDRYTGTENSYREAYWKNYAGDTTHRYHNGTSWVDEDRYYVQGHVFVTPTGKSLIDGYADSYTGSMKYASAWGANKKYDDFKDFLTNYETPAVNPDRASSSQAVKYVIDANELVNYYFDDSMNVLDIEPSVKMSSDGYSYEWNFDGSDVIKLIPKRIGTDTRIRNIEHQVMQQFVSKNEDLNSKYDLIYIGDDIGGLWTGYDLADSKVKFASKNNTVVGTEDQEVWVDPVYNVNWSGSKFYKNGTYGYFGNGGYRKANGRDWHYPSGTWGVGEYCQGEWGAPFTIVSEGHYEIQKVNIYGVAGATAGPDRTDFVDDAMDGLVYFHLGDTLKVNLTSDANFIAGTTGQTTRQAGNDLTEKKLKKLVEYMQAEYPIVIADTLYNNGSMEHPYVDQSAQCVLKKFLTTYDPGKTGATLKYYTKDMLDDINKMVSNRLKGRVTITLPNETTRKMTIYDSSKSDDEKYLRAPDGTATLYFDINVPNKTDYAYRVFIDRNRDSVFTEDWSNDEKNEVITSRMVPLTDYENKISVRMPDKWVGFVQWRIEVVDKNNIMKRYSMEGCSAVKADDSPTASPDRAKQKIVALQIMPTHSRYNDNHDRTGSLVDLSNNSLNGKKSTTRSGAWQGLYSLVNDFDITVVKITWRQFMLLFKKSYDTQIGGVRQTFKYNMGSPINITDDASSNPNKNTLQTIESTPIAFDNLNDDTLNVVTGTDAENYYTLADFNMIVLGFDDTYGFTDMSNWYGSVEYLYYFAQKGCSILFTHDTTSSYTNKDNSPYNIGWITITNHTTDQWHEVRKFGYTGNTMMREIMGMNRYMKTSKYLVGTTRDTNEYVNFRADLAANIQSFVSSNNIQYDKGYDGITMEGLQGYTIFNLMRYICTDKNNGKEGRIQNKYMVINPKTGKLIKDDSNNRRSGGTYNDGGNTLSQVVTRVNEGQITQYPFTIGTGTGASRKTDFEVGQTHGQWWMLNMEDEDLTVWYTLQDPAMSTIDCGDKQKYKDRNDYEHISLMYSAVPQDAANNYYIYSKGNIFYSGVGHTAVHDGEEQKLFVNTLVAAFRPKYGLPFIQVTSSEASLIKNSPRTYSVTLPVDYLYNPDGTFAGTEVLLSEGEFTDANYVYVKFKAMDNNGCTEIFTKARYDETTEEVTIYSSLANAKNGTASISKNLSGDYVLTVGSEYYIRYPKSNLNTSKKKILFESYNTRITTGEKDSTYLEFNSQPLFRLD